MKQVYDNLYVGDLNDADNHSQHTNNNIEYILNVSGNSSPGRKTIRDKTYIHTPIADDGSNPDFLINTVIETAKRLHQKSQEENVSLLIHCAVGSSRSVSIAASLMSLENGKRVRENVTRIKKVRPAANPQPDLLDQVSRITAELYNN